MRQGQDFARRRRYVVALMEKPKTPELDKILAIRGESEAIGQFIEWLQYASVDLSRHAGEGRRAAVLATKERHSAIRLCRIDRSGEWWPISNSIEDLLARYFEIDQDKAEKERTDLLEFVQAQQAVRE